MNCKHCNNEANSKFCPECGQPTSLNRINGRYIIFEIGNVLNFERGLFHTIKELIINPGACVRTYLTENRKKLVKPVLFIVITSLVYSLCNSFFHFEDDLVNKIERPNSATTAIADWVRGNYGYANIIMAIFIAFWTKIFFRKYKFNIYEILVLLCYVMGMGMLFLSAFGIIQSLINNNLVIIASLVSFVYTTWAIGQFYEKSKIASYLKAFLAYLLGTLTFYLIGIVIGTIIDLITKQ